MNKIAKIKQLFADYRASAIASMICFVFCLCLPAFDEARAAILGVAFVAFYFFIAGFSIKRKHEAEKEYKQYVQLKLDEYLTSIGSDATCKVARGPMHRIFYIVNVSGEVDKNAIINVLNECGLETGIKIRYYIRKA